MIDAILATADLETVTRKKARKGLEKALGGKDLSDRKVGFVWPRLCLALAEPDRAAQVAIKNLIEARFDAINSQTPPSGTLSLLPTPPVQRSCHDGGHMSRKCGSRQTVGHGTNHDTERETDKNGSALHDPETRGIKQSLEDDDYDQNNGPAKKKHKRSSSSIEDADARLAAELQAQENRLARTTRGGGSARPTKPRKVGGGGVAARKKSAARIKDEDGVGGSDVESEASGSAVKEKRKASGGFQKPFNLSYQLGELVGVTQLSRPQVVKRLWQHIKENDLQDPTDKRQIRCDDKMQAVFKQHKIDMFQMNKLLSNHLYPVDEE